MTLVLFPSITSCLERHGKVSRWLPGAEQLQSSGSGDRTCLEGAGRSHY